MKIPPFKDAWVHWTTAAVLLVFLTVNLIHIRDFSRTPDENRVIERGTLSLRLAGSLLGLNDPLTEPEWSQLRNQFHPPLFGILNSLTVIAVKPLGLDDVESLHVLPLIFSTAGLGFLFLLAARLFGPLTGLFSVLFMIFFPRFIAHAHYNPKDIPTMVLSVATLHRFLIARDYRSPFNVITAGVCLGASISTGLNGLLLIPIVLAASAADHRWPDQRPVRYVNLRTGKNTPFWGFFILSTLTTVWVTWPQLWLEPFHIVRSIAHFSGTDFFPQKERLRILYFGISYFPLDLPWHYTLMHVLMSTPVLSLVLAATGLAVSLRNGTRKTASGHLCLILLFVLPILIRSRSGVFRYNEMRHVFMSIPALAVTSAVGLTWLLGALAKFKGLGKPALLAVVPAVLFGYMLRDVARWHPYEGSYYNEIVRWSLPRHIESQFLISPWGVTCRQAVDWLNRNATPNASVCVHCEGVRSSFDYRPDLTPACEGPVDYMTTTSDMLRWPGFEKFDPHQAVHAEQRFDSDIFYVFQKGKNGF